MNAHSNERSLPSKENSNSNGVVTKNQVESTDSVNKTAYASADQTVKKTTEEVQYLDKQDVQKRLDALGKQLLDLMNRTMAADRVYARNPSSRGAYLQALQEERKALLDGDAQFSGHPLAAAIRGVHRSRLDMIERAIKNLAVSGP